eukprot:766955-Hanusia_phi.AAC.9
MKGWWTDVEREETLVSLNPSKRWISVSVTGSASSSHFSPRPLASAPRLSSPSSPSSHPSPSPFCCPPSPNASPAVTLPIVDTTTILQTEGDSGFHQVLRLCPDVESEGGGRESKASLRCKDDPQERVHSRRRKLHRSLLLLHAEVFFLQISPSFNAEFTSSVEVCASGCVCLALTLLLHEPSPPAFVTNPFATEDHGNDSSRCSFLLASSALSFHSSRLVPPVLTLISISCQSRASIAQSTGHSPRPH